MKLTCPKCGTMFYYPDTMLKQAIIDKNNHMTRLCSKLAQNQPLPDMVRNIHRPYTSFSYFMFKTLKERSMVGTYMTWLEWNTHEFNNWNRNEKLYDEWHDSLRYTCYNLPCPSCLQHEYERHTFDKRTYAKGKSIEKKFIAPRAFIQHSSGSIEYL